MAYSDFTLMDLQAKFELGHEIVDLFDKHQINPLQPSDFLQKQLSEARKLPIKSEKSRSELLILPILLESRRINNDFFTVYSGDTLTADKEKGLSGECDYIITKDTNSYYVNNPIITIAEAKKQDIELGINQCSAQLYGAYTFNQQFNSSVSKIYGCTTTGEVWKFILLENNVLQIDRNEYFLNEVDKILGVFQVIVDYYKVILN